MEPAVFNKARMRGLVLAEELFKMREHRDIGRCDSVDLDATLQVSLYQGPILVTELMRADSPDVPSIRTWEGCSFRPINSSNFGTLIHLWSRNI